ncbi:unnamed protein product [Microthlaspi erraticum]|uniref:Glabrous enhancer-binding protein-like DBD domain-containing protein n=1 Tax=Microthlaspi erraticum TaxID=1685480 RepID=A0A6D2IBZ6_9BRAS|nr:unnamed protein product [Microthlaspi erraticum]
MKKAETALAAAEKRQVSSSDSETDRKDPAVKPEPVADSDRHVTDVSTERKDPVVKPEHTTMERVWSDEEEIAVLQSLMDYETVTGIVFHADHEAVYQWVKKSLTFDITMSQFLYKTSKLADTYHLNGKEMETFARPHHRKCFDISNYLWGPKRRFSKIHAAYLTERQLEDDLPVAAYIAQGNIEEDLAEEEEEEEDEAA